MNFSKSINIKKRISWIIVFSLIFSFILPITTFAEGEGNKEVEQTEPEELLKEENKDEEKVSTDKTSDAKETEEKKDINEINKSTKHITVDEAINKTVNYYKANNPGNPNGDWEAYIGLWGVGQRIEKDYEWESIDPGFGSDLSTNETPNYSYGLLGQGQDPSNIWGGRNLFEELSTQQREDGVFTNIGKHIFSMILLDAGEKMGADVGKWNEENRQRAIDGLLNLQNPDGSFGTFSFLDHTGWSLVALSEYRDQVKVDEAINKALAFLKSKQTDTGAFDYNGDNEKGENSNSISTVIQGLVAVGEDVSNSNGKWSKNGNTPLNALLAYQKGDGSFLWKHGMDITGPSTKQALVALADVKNKKSTWLRLGDEIELESVSKEKLEKNVEELISFIKNLPKTNKINLNNKVEIIKAYNIYLSLPEEYKLKVTNSDLLLKSKETIVIIEKEIKSINDGIWDLPGKPSDINLSHKEKVLNLIKKYNSLSDSDKKHITYYSEVVAAKKQIDKLQKEVDSIVKNINNLPKDSAIKLKDKDKIKSIYSEYMKLSKESKAEVKNINKLMNAKQIVEKLEKEAQKNESQDKVKVEIPNGNKDYKVPVKKDDKEVTINIPEKKQSKVLIDLPKGEKLPEILAKKGHISALIPKGARIVSGNGKNIELISSMDINDSSLKEKVSKILSKGEELEKISQVFSMGTDERIEFSEYVTLTFTGMKGKQAAYIEDGKLHKIQKFPSNEEGLNSGSLEYAYEAGNDLIVKTKHFTDFIAYETKDKNIKAENESKVINENNDNYSSPKTGDEGIMIPIILLLISSLAIVFLAKKRKIN